MRRIRPLSQLAAAVAGDPALFERVQDDPVQATTLLAAEEALPDTWVYRAVVIALDLAVLACIVGAIILSANGKEIPQTFIALGFAAVGALAGLAPGLHLTALLVRAPRGGSRRWPISGT